MFSSGFFRLPPTDRKTNHGGSRRCCKYRERKVEPELVFNLLSRLFGFRKWNLESTEHLDLYQSTVLLLLTGELTCTMSPGLLFRFPLIRCRSMNTRYTPAPSAGVLIHQQGDNKTLYFDNIKRIFSAFFCLCSYQYYSIFLVVQKMDNVTEGMQNYGGKINAVEADLKKLGNPVLSKITSSMCVF